MQQFPNPSTKLGEKFFGADHFEYGGIIKHKPYYIVISKLDESEIGIKLFELFVELGYKVFAITTGSGTPNNTLQIRPPHFLFKKKPKDPVGYTLDIKRESSDMWIVAIASHGGTHYRHCTTA